MKKYTFILIALVMSSFFACNEDESKRPAGGSWDSAPIDGYAITPINGGAVISYNIPDDPDILYVMAEYERNGIIYTEKSSVHKNSLKIEGFHDVDKVKASLYKVNKQEQRSKPIVVEFEPLESLIDIAYNSWSVQPGFGGLIASWENPEATELGVRLMAEGNENMLETKDMYFTSIKKDRHAFRPFESVQTNFAVSFEDKWGNVSDTIKFTTTPLFEVMIPKPYADYRPNIPWDNFSNYSGRNISLLWDNIVNTSGHGWLTASGNSGLSITIDLKQIVKLSRIVRHPYHLNSLYSQANITDFEAWGIDKIDYDKLADKPYWLDSLSVRWGAIKTVDPLTEIPAKTFKDDWTYLGRNTVPLGLSTADANAMAASGVESDVPFDAKPVRYVRIFVRAITNTSPPPISNYFSCSELTFYGDTSVPQE